MKTSVTKLFSFEAGHYLPNYDGACSRFHGHSYKLSVTVSGELCKKTGMVADFKKVSKTVKSNIVSKYDHQWLNDFFDMPTAENMCSDFFEVLDKEFTAQGLTLESVKLWETSDSYAECRR